MIEQTLSRSTAKSPQWAEVVRLLGVRLTDARERLELLTLTEQQTASLRGRISTLKELLALDNPPPVTDDEPTPRRRTVDTE